MATAETTEPTKRTRTTVNAVREEVEALIEAGNTQVERHKRDIAAIFSSIDAYKRVLALMDKSGE